jgi:hypothetical protein
MCPKAILFGHSLERGQGFDKTTDCEAIPIFAAASQSPKKALFLHKNVL